MQTPRVCTSTHTRTLSHTHSTMLSVYLLTLTNSAEYVGYAEGTQVALSKP